MVTELKSMAHTTEFHESLKRDLSQWNCLMFIGNQVIDAWEDEPEEVLEMRNCSCGSTLCRKIK